ncbi:MAG TPA: hypothetical protein VLK82_18675 [Candidatus Tectomicrobia bacterium]|nr:hypothetical protein [Candidatus Tectomicrobia bacterium]
MTPEDITVVQESFQKVASIADQAAEIFYRNLLSRGWELTLRRK